MQSNNDRSSQEVRLADQEVTLDKNLRNSVRGKPKVPQKHGKNPRPWHVRSQPTIFRLVWPNAVPILFRMRDATYLSAISKQVQ
jgi:hypothetical protein